MSKATGQAIAQGFGQGLINLAQGFSEGKQNQRKLEAEEQERGRKQRAAETLLDPNASSIQKAQAASHLGEKTLNQFIQRESENQLTNQIFGDRGTPENIGTRAGAGAINPIQAPGTGIYQNQPGFPAANLMNEMQTNQPQEQPAQPQQGQGWGQFDTPTLKKIHAGLDLVVGLLSLLSRS